MNKILLYLISACCLVAAIIAIFAVTTLAGLFFVFIGILFITLLVGSLLVYALMKIFGESRVVALLKKIGININYETEETLRDKNGDPIEDAVVLEERPGPRNSDTST